MDQRRQFIVGVFDYRLTTEHVETEALVDDLAAIGVPADEVRIFAPPFGRHDFEGLRPALEGLGMDEPTARWSEQQYRAGKVLIVIGPGASRPEVEEILQRQGVLEVRIGQGTDPR